MSAVRRSAPEPFQWAPSQFWDGNDGSWSSFIVQVGTPPQDFRVFPSTAGQETLVPVPEGCVAGDPTNCGNLRGVMPFQGNQGTGFVLNESTSWQSINIDTTNLEDQLGYQVNAIYGLDTVGLGIENSNGITMANRVVGGIAAKDFYLGVFGLGPKPSNFSTFATPVPSFMTSLNTSSQIPSHSFAYNAGASYRYAGVFGSLTLGGYDSSRATPSNITFPFAEDDSRPLQVGVQSILGTGTLLGSANLLPTAVFALVDSTVPEIWLPQAACDRFATAFGLTYDNTTTRYLVNDTMHSKLVDLNPTVTFVIGLSNYGGTTQNIVLPYAAFDLQLSYPYNVSKYFPIRVANGTSQYTIGRTFLQEAYLIVDYERKNFSVSQAIYSDPMPSQLLVSIEPLMNNTGNHTASVHKLSSGSLAGIIVGAILAVAIAVTGIILILRHRKNRRRPILDTIDEKNSPSSSDDSQYRDEKRESQRGELSDENQINEVSGGETMPEMDGEADKWGLRGVQELPVPPAELEAFSATK